MCGRYTLGTCLEELVERFDVAEVTLSGHRPRFNIAPTQNAPVIVGGQLGRRLGALRWGLVPFWAPDPSSGPRFVNARSETARDKPAFRDAFRRRRCIVPADGFYEWKIGEGPRTTRRSKTPFWVHRRDRSPFAMAGLWERWESRNDTGGVFQSFTILTTRATSGLRSIHDRMPVVLAAESVERWLDPESREDALADLLRPVPEGVLEAWPVGTLVNSPQFDDSACIEPFVDGGRSG